MLSCVNPYDLIVRIDSNDSKIKLSLDSGCCQATKGVLIPVFLPKEPSPKDILLTAVLYALSDEVRLEIVRQLAERGELPCGVFEVDRPKSSLSHHFRVLRESGLVSTKRSGTVLLNTLRREEIEGRFPGLISAVLEEKTAKRRKVR